MLPARPRVDWVEGSSAIAEASVGQACSGREAVGLERLIAGPDGPGDASECVGQSDGGFVVTFARLEREGPELDKFGRNWNEG